jgi:hypothetical protein
METTFDLQDDVVKQVSELRAAQRGGSEESPADHAGMALARGGGGRTSCPVLTRF